MSDTIREFLVALGFEVREDTLNRFERAIEGATLRAKLLGDAIEGMASSAAESVVKTADNFERLYWQAKRLNTSVADINAFAYAVGQMGGNVEQAKSSLEGFGQYLKYNAGTRNLVSQRLGHRMKGSRWTSSR